MSGGHVRVAVFGGAGEGRALAAELVRRGVWVRLFVATEYGGAVVAPMDGLDVCARRMDAAEMIDALREFECPVAVDATHPYADEASRNIKAACDEAGIRRIRLLRGESDGFDGGRAVGSAAEAAALLEHLPGRALLAVGSKELAAFTSVTGWRERLTARVLPDPQVVEKCAVIGFSGKNLICMQGPFSHEMNVATLRMTGASILVTKESGSAGGFPEKLSAARETGAELVVITRPGEAEQGLSSKAVLRELETMLGIAHVSKYEKRFPIFISLEGAPVLVVGGGRVAARRIRTLLEFGAAITVLSPELCPELALLTGRINWWRCKYSGIASEFRIVIAATSERAVNRRVGADANALGIPVSVADRREESSFWFPAVVCNENTVTGLVSTEGGHRRLRDMAGKLRQLLRET